MTGVDCDVLLISVYGELTIVLNNQKEQSERTIQRQKFMYGALDKDKQR
jgi:hypothetical protein